MVVEHDTSPREETRRSEPGWPRVAKQLLTIFGAIALFLGFFILFGGEDQYLGIADRSWRVGDIAEGWAYGLLAAGGLMLVTVAVWLVQGRSRRRS